MYHEFSQSVENYEKMRSNFKDGQPKQRYSFDGYEHLVINNFNAKMVLKTVKKALSEKRPVTGLIWASEAFKNFDGKGIFDQKLGGKADHVIMIEAYGNYRGNEFFRIKNSWTSKWGGDGKGRACVAVRQIREFTYIKGDVYCMGPVPPKRILVFHTTTRSKELAKGFVQRSNEKYAKAPPVNCVHSSGHSAYCRHADFIFILNDLESYATSKLELELKLKKESLVLFLLDNTRSDKKYLKSLEALSAMENKGKCIHHLQYSVFGRKSVDKKIYSNLHKLGASSFHDSVIDDGHEETFTKWQEMIWTNLDKYGAEKKNGVQ